MQRNSANDIFINGSNDPSKIADAFAQEFETVYCISGATNIAKQEFDLEFLNASCTLTNANQFDPSLISVELVDRCMRKLKLGKASGPDELGAEHLINAHPSLVVHLSLLFRGIALHAYVPDDFGSGIIVPLLKDKSGNVNDLGNYRGITLIPVISKLFELVILEICKPCFQTDDLQFGFKEGLGCSNAIMVLNETVKHFTSKGSSVFAAALDFKKCFDSINHFKLFTSLLKAGVPAWVVAVLCDWYSKLNVSVRWKGSLSGLIKVHSGVRQGTSLSPAIFNVFTNIFICKLKSLNYGCKMNAVFVGAIMYADDLILLSATVHGLQQMLNCCTTVCSESLLEFNSRKCTCVKIGPALRLTIDNFKLVNDSLTWASCFKYLGVTFQAGLHLTVDINVIKRSFFASCNCILGNVKCMNDILKLNLMESFCLPILLYATAALNLSPDQLADLNAGWNSAYRRIFGFNRWESIRSFIAGIGRLDFHHIRANLYFKFCKFGVISQNIVFRNIMIRHTFTHEFKQRCNIYGLQNINCSSINGLSVNRLKGLLTLTFQNTC